LLHGEKRDLTTRLAAPEGLQATGIRVARDVALLKERRSGSGRIKGLWIRHAACQDSSSNEKEAVREHGGLQLAQHLHRPGHVV